MALTEQQLAITTFWRWFEANQSQLNSLADTSEPLWDTALEKLKAISQELWFELSSPEITPREFVITAEGRVEFFPLVEEIVQNAPEIPGWQFVSLKPPLGFDFEITYEGIEIDPRTLWFLPLENPDNQAVLGLRIGVPSYDAANERPVSNAVLVILDTALGERAAATEVQCVEVVCSPEAPDKEGYISLPELPDYVECRKQKLRKP